MSLVSQFRQQIRTYIYNPVYKGPFDYKRKHAFMTRFPFGVSPKKLESEAEEIQEIRSMNVEEPSPFHLVMRIKNLGKNHWSHKLILRRLGMHHRENDIPVVVPNTPHYNAMLWEIKHLIKLKPLRFPDGIPTEADIGSVKVDIHSGEMRINPAYHISETQLEKAKTPDMFTGKYLREYLKWSSGIVGNSLPSHEVRQIDGGNIEQHDRNMKDYHKHAHPYYKSK